MHEAHVAAAPTAAQAPASDSPALRRRTARAITPETMLRHVRPVAGPTCSCTSVTNRSTSGVVTSWSRSAPRASKHARSAAVSMSPLFPATAAPASPIAPTARTTRSPQPRKCQSPEDSLRPAEPAPQGGLKRGPGRPFRSRVPPTIRRTPSKSRNHARARYSDPPGDFDTDTSPHSPGLSRRRGIARPQAESSGPARRTRPTREIEGAFQAESLAGHSLASASHRSSAWNTQERGDIRCRPQRVMPGAHRPPFRLLRRHRLAGSLGPRLNRFCRRAFGCDVADRGDRYAPRAADLDRLQLLCCDQPVHPAVTHPEYVGASAAAMSGSMIVFLSCLVGFSGRRGSNLSGGDTCLESLTLEDNQDQQEEVPAAAVFIMIGAKPHTDWLARPQPRQGRLRADRPRYTRYQLGAGA